MEFKASCMWVGWVFENGANTAGWLSRHVTTNLGVAFVSPACAPGVLDQVVVGAITNSQNSVVSSSSTLAGAGQDATLVALEVVGGSSDSN